MKRSNCFFFALWLYWKRGGYLAVRKCRVFPGWHWLWSPDLKQWISWNPKNKTNTKFWFIALDKLWYKGYIKRGDKHET